MVNLSSFFSVGQTVLLFLAPLMKLLNFRSVKAEETPHVMATNLKCHALMLVSECGGEHLFALKICVLEVVLFSRPVSVVRLESPACRHILGPVGPQVPLAHCMR